MVDGSETFAGGAEPSAASAPWPISTSDVANVLGIADDAANTWLGQVTDATVAYVEHVRRDLFRITPPTGTVPASVSAGALIHAANLYRRRDTLAGGQYDALGTLAALPVDDPTVERLLGIGRHRGLTARAG